MQSGRERSALMLGPGWKDRGGLEGDLFLGSELLEQAVDDVVAAHARRLGRKGGEDAVAQDRLGHRGNVAGGGVEASANDAAAARQLMPPRMTTATTPAAAAQAGEQPPAPGYAECAVVRKPLASISACKPACPARFVRTAT